MLINSLPCGSGAQERGRLLVGHLLCDFPRLLQQHHKAPHLIGDWTRTIAMPVKSIMTVLVLRIGGRLGGNIDLEVKSKR